MVEARSDGSQDSGTPSRVVRVVRPWKYPTRITSRGARIFFSPSVRPVGFCQIAGESNSPSISHVLPCDFLTSFCTILLDSENSISSKSIGVQSASLISHDRVNNIPLTDLFGQLTSYNTSSLFYTAFLI